MSDVEKILKEKILESDMSVSEISRKSGVSSGAIFGWLNNQKTPTIWNVSFVLDVLGYELFIRQKEEE